ncbi:MAG: sugar transferase [Acidobacteriota bacterium]
MRHTVAMRNTATAFDRTKRWVDGAVAALGLVAASPVLAVIAVLIKLTSRGPVLYRARRAGLHGVPFEVLKLRTMTDGADRHGTITVGGDARVTPLGRLLRLTKLDEVPQLWNVLRGEMALVGPRPESLNIVEEHYTAAHRQALSVRPGLTCSGSLYYYVYQEHLRPPAGVGPETFYVRELLDAKIAADLHYVEHRSMAYDLRLIVETVWVMLCKILGVAPRWQPPIPVASLRLPAQESPASDTSRS